MNIISWIIFGLIVGVVAHLVDPRDVPGGLVASTILGIVGSLVGGFLGNLVFGVGVSGFNFSSLIVAVLGSLLVVMVQRMFVRA